MLFLWGNNTQSIIYGRVSPSSSEIRHCTYSSHMLHEYHPGGVKGGGQGSIEPPITIEIQWVTPIQIDALQCNTHTIFTQTRLHPNKKQQHLNSITSFSYNIPMAQPSAPQKKYLILGETSQANLLVILRC